MTIKASKFLIGIISFCVSLSFFFTLGFIYCLLDEFSRVTVSVVVSSSINLSVVAPFVVFVMYNGDIEVQEEAVGGYPISEKRFQARQFVSRENVDVEKSLRRVFLDRLLGNRKIYDVQGGGFEFNEYFFTKKSLKLVHRKILDVYGISVT